MTRVEATRRGHESWLHRRLQSDRDDRRQARPRPVMTDAQRHDQVGYASGGHFETPELDALAASGVDLRHGLQRVDGLRAGPGRAAHRAPPASRPYAREPGRPARRVLDCRARAPSGGLRDRPDREDALCAVHAQHGFETMRLCEHLSCAGPRTAEQARGDEIDDYHDWLIEQGLPDWRVGGRRDDRHHGTSRGGPPHGLDRTRGDSSFLATRDRRPSPVPRRVVPAPARAIRPPRAVRVDVRPGRLDAPAGRATRSTSSLPMVFRLATSASSRRTEGGRHGPARRCAASSPSCAAWCARSTTRSVASSRSCDLDVHPRVLHVGPRRLSPVIAGLLRKTPWMPFDDLARVPFIVAGGRRLGRPARSRSSSRAVTSRSPASTTPAIEPPDGWSFDTRSLRPDPGRGTESPATSSGRCSRPPPCTGRWSGRAATSTSRTPNTAAVLFDLHDDPHEQDNRLLDPALAGIRDDLDRATARGHEPAGLGHLCLGAPVGSPQEVGATSVWWVPVSRLGRARPGTPRLPDNTRCADQRTARSALSVRARGIESIAGRSGATD